MKNEMLQILDMVKEGKITNEEAVELLNAINETKEKLPNVKKAKWLRVRVLEPDNSTKVNITIPVALFDIGMRIASKVAPNFVPELREAGLDEIDINEIFEAIKQGASGKIVDVESEKGEKVEIIVE